MASRGTNKGIKKQFKNAVHIEVVAYKYYHAERKREKCGAVHVCPQEDLAAVLLLAFTAV